MPPKNCPAFRPRRRRPRTHQRSRTRRSTNSATHWRSLADQGAPETLASSIEAKLAANEAARQIAGLALRAGGESAYLKTHPIERHFRDAHSGGLMAYSAEVCRDFIGKQVLGIGAEANAFG